jgi:lipid-A-disaccharide synthase-like uncharacterized protein
MVRADGPTDEFERTRQEIQKHVSESELTHDEVTQWIAFSENVKRAVKQNLSPWDRFVRAVRDPWVFFGLAAQATFMMRFVLQIVASERKKKSYVPIGFWYLSIIGGSMLFVYALQLRDPVFVLGQGLGIFIYTRNLMLIYRRRGTFQDSMALRQQRADSASGNQSQDGPNGS